MAKTVTIGTTSDDETLIKAIQEYQHANKINSMPNAVRHICRKALNLTEITIKIK